LLDVSFIQPSLRGNHQEAIVMNLKNVGNIDRVLRVILGLVLLSLVFYGPQTPWGWIGLVPLITGLLSWCPAYSLFGIKTCRISH
jgi:membrane-associated protease RseP (regulator of RpoE activity)